MNRMGLRDMFTSKAKRADDFINRENEEYGMYQRSPQSKKRTPKAIQKGKEKVHSFSDQAIQNMALWDWLFVECALVVFGILLVRWQPTIFSSIDWYWWFIAMIAAVAIPIVNVYKKPLLKKNQSVRTNTYPMREFRLVKQNFQYLDWALAKIAILFFGIGISVALPQIPLSLPLLMWVVLFSICMFVPLYFITSYVPKNGSKFNQVRMRYTRRKNNATSAIARAADLDEGYNTDWVKKNANKGFAVMFRSSKKRKAEEIVEDAEFRDYVYNDPGRKSWEEGGYNIMFRSPQKKKKKRKNSEGRFKLW